MNYNLVIEVGAMLTAGRRYLLLKDSPIDRMPTDLVGFNYKSIDLDDPSPSLLRYVNGVVRTSLSGAVKTAETSLQTATSRSPACFPAAVNADRNASFRCGTANQCNSLRRSLEEPRSARRVTSISAMRARAASPLGRGFSDGRVHLRRDASGRSRIR